MISGRWRRAAIKAGEVLGIRLTTIHNIHFLTNLMKNIRTAILEDRYPEFIAEFYADFSRGGK